MDTYIDELAPWERRSAYYKDVKIGKKKLEELKRLLKNQTQEMISSRIASTGEVISSQEIRKDAAKEISYDMKSIGKGMGGLKASFEWGISDVVWLIEKQREELRNVLMHLYDVPDRQVDDLRYKAEESFADGNVESALEAFTELDSFINDDFSVCMNIGMIYLFHIIDKKKALAYFDRAIKYVRPYSPYYTSYALLYKALIKRDFGLIEEAEQCSGEAMKLSSGLTEAMYQNAQYNALLNRPAEAIPLLKRVIQNDIVYCLKIWWDKAFEQIKSEITGMYEEIRDGKNRKVQELLDEEKKNILLLNSTVKSIEKLGHHVSRETSVELFEEENREIEKLVKNNSIIDAHIGEILLALLSKKLIRKKELLKRKGNEIHFNLENQIKELSAEMTGKKKRGGSVSFLIHFLCGQIVAFPFGWYIGLPLGICITEGLLLAICYYFNVTVPQSQWEEVTAKQNEQEKLLRVMKKL